MADLYADLFVTDRGFHDFGASTSEAFRMTTCAHCGPTQAGVVAFTAGERVHWLRCTNCGRGIVEVDGRVSPGTKPLGVPLGLPPAELDIWEQVRDCLSVGASTAAVMLCRKLLLHLAVAAELPAKDENGRAPSFAAAIAHLKAEGLITPKMTPWVERIKDVGNEANHELRSVSSELALDVAKFTEQLLRLNFEMDALMARSDETDADESDGFAGRIAHLTHPALSRSTWVS